MPAQIRASISDIIQAVKARLMTATGFPAERVFNAARERVPHFQGEQDLVLRPGSFRSRQEFNDGAGRVATVCVRTLGVIVRTRGMLDTGGQDDIWLMTPDLVSPETGYFELENAVIAALQDFLPEDGNGNTLLGEPMRLIGGSEPRRETGDKNTGWGAGRLDFELMYVQSMTAGDDA